MLMHSGELEHVMSTSGSTSLSPHRVAIVMSPCGRFLQCRDCQLEFEFPAGVHFDAIAQQFAFHLCRPRSHPFRKTIR
jgi:hypothetical protein